MKNARKFGIVLFSIVIMISIVACGGSSATPTNPPPPPTNTPVPPPPTDVPPPPTAVPPTEAPAPTETTGGGETPPNIVAGQLNVLAVNGYQDDWGDWTIVGLVSNNTERFVNDIEVEVELFDASNNSLYVDTTYTSLYSLAPGEVTPFTMYVWDDIPDATSFTATITGNGTSSAERATVEVANSTLMLDKYDDLQIVGELVNNSTDVVSINGMAAAVFDGAGTLVSADSVNATIRYLEPGESGPFRITVDAPADQAASLTDYEIYVDAQITTEAEKYDLVLSDATFDYVDAYDYFHLVGQITNNSDSYMNVSLIAGLYDASGNVVDAASASLPVYSLAPGETLPYDFDYWGPVNYVDGAYDAATQYNIFIDWYWTWDTSTVLVDLTTQNDANEFDEYQGTFTGQVVNNTDAEIESATVIVALYQVGTDTLVAVGYDWLWDAIPVGGTGDYEVYVDIPAGWAAADVEYVLIIKGEK